MPELYPPPALMPIPIRAWKIAVQTLGSMAEILLGASSSGEIKQRFPDLATFSIG